MAPIVANMPGGSGTSSGARLGYGLSTEKEKQTADVGDIAIKELKINNPDMH